MLGVAKTGEVFVSASASPLTEAGVVNGADRTSECCSGLGKAGPASCLTFGEEATGARLGRAGVWDTEVLRFVLPSGFLEWLAEFSLRGRSRSAGIDDNSGKSEAENAGVCEAAGTEDATTGDETGREEETSGEIAARAGETSAAEVEGENWGKGAYSDTIDYDAKNREDAVSETVRLVLTNNCKSDIRMKRRGTVIIWRWLVT